MAQLEALKEGIDNQGTAGLYPGDGMTNYHVHLSEDPLQTGYILEVLGAAGGNSKNRISGLTWEELIERLGNLPQLPTDQWELL